MGYLFGRDAAKRTVERGQVEWQMSLGITYNTKKELKHLLDAYEKGN
jgi:hypothetical protein